MQILSCFRKKFGLNRSVRLTGVVICAVMLAFVFCRVELSSAGMPTLAEKKTVVLEKNNSEAEHIFAVACTKCHAAPDPLQPASGKTECWKGLSKGEQNKVQIYIADVVKGKRHYESYCGRCHDLIPPGAHNREYWSKNVCTSEECFIKKMSKEEEQQVLLYLRSQAKKD